MKVVYHLAQAAAVTVAAVAAAIAAIAYRGDNTALSNWTLAAAAAAILLQGLTVWAHARASKPGPVGGLGATGASEWRGK